MNNNNSPAPIFDLDNFIYQENYALEASAGTGKTYSITEIIKKLLLEHHLGLDKILVVTYTEKAAGELKNRIREILTTPNKDLNGQSIKEHLNGQVNCDVDNASIGTIHSFCKNTIKEFAISANQPLNLDLAGDADIINFAYRFIREGNMLSDITKLLSVNFEVDEGALVASLVAATNSYYLDIDYKEDESIISYLPKYTEDKLNSTPFLMYISPDPIQTLHNMDINLYNYYLVLL